MSELVIRRILLSGGLACLALDGTLDGRTAGGLEKELEEAARLGVSRLVFDLGSLDVLTSAGAGVLLGAVLESQERGGGLALVNPCPQVQHVLDILGLRDLFPLAPDLVSAAACIDALCAVAARAKVESA